MAMKKVYSKKTGKVTWAQPNPARPGEYLMPADATEFPPPAFDDSTKKAKYVNNSWVTEDLSAEELHEASGSTGTFIAQLGDIANVTLDSITDGQALIWDATNNKWTNGNVAAGEGSVSSSIGSGAGVQQVKQATKSDSWYTRENDFVDIPGLTITLTPRSENSKFLIIADLMTSTDYYCGEIQLAYNGSYIYQADVAGSRPRSSIIVGREPSPHGESERSTLHYVHEPNTTEPVTYKLMGRGRKDNQNDGGLFINRTPPDRDTNTFDGRGISSLIVMEIDESNGIQNIVDSQTGPPETYFVASIARPTAKWYNNEYITTWTLREQQGNSFDSSTGVFTAPKQGLYRFDFFDNFRAGSGGMIYWDWHKNNTHIGYGRVYGQHDGGWEGMSGHLIISLEEGDTMRINFVGNGGLDPDGNGYSLFTGYIMNQGANVTISNGTSYTELDTDTSQGPTSLADNSELPSYACRAFCTFNGDNVTTVNGESHCQILTSGNISKVTRHGTGRYTIHFKTPMPDNKYSPSVTGTGGGTNSGYAQLDTQEFNGSGSHNFWTDRFNIRSVDGGGTMRNHSRISIQVFR
ncbi:MAG: hypothetical protein VW270_00030 [Candidatus Poseidoniales archaeon]